MVIRFFSHLVGKGVRLGATLIPRKSEIGRIVEKAGIFIVLSCPRLRDDILFGKLRPYFHKVVKVAMDGICTSELLVLRSKMAKHRALVGGIVFSTTFVEYASKKWGGAQMPRADWKLMKQFNFAMPTDDILEEFNSVVLPTWSLGDNNQQQNRKLAQLRDWLLPMLMNGQVMSCGVTSLLDIMR